MKKFVLLLLLTAASQYAGAQLSATYDHCLARAGGNTVQVSVCVQREMTLQDARLNRAYTARLRSLPTAEAKSTLKTAEREWIKTRDAKCLVGGSTVDNVCLLRETADRATELSHPAGQ